MLNRRTGWWDRWQTWRRQGWPAPGLRRVSGKQWVAAVLLLAAFCSAYAVTATIVFHQAAFLSEPGDRLVVVFRPGTTTATALARLGDAGTVLAGTGRLPGFYQAEVLHPSAPQRLAGGAWIMRVPQQPTLQGCFGVVTDTRR